MSDTSKTQPETGAEAATKNRAYDKCKKCFQSPCICPKHSTGQSAASGGQTTGTSSRSSVNTSQPSQENSSNVPKWIQEAKTETITEKWTLRKTRKIVRLETQV